MVCGSQVRFQSTKSTFSILPPWRLHPAHQFAFVPSRPALASSFPSHTYEFVTWSDQTPGLVRYDYEFVWILRLAQPYIHIFLLAKPARSYSWSWPLLLFVSGGNGFIVIPADDGMLTRRSLMARGSCPVGNPSDEGMTRGSSILAYLVFGPRRTSAEGTARPTSKIARRGSGARLGVQCKTRGDLIKLGLV
jgi:hypothetical protein